MSTSHPLDIIVVERLGSLKMLSIKDFKQEDLYKKCGFKKAEDFNKQTEWTLKYDGNKYLIQVFAKINGKANSENKYDFPPPIDNSLFYGSCAIVAKLKHTDGTSVYANLSLSMWNKMYEKLFGGFEDLHSTAKEDECEEDELNDVPNEQKTKQGYLKDGFVVDSSDTEDTTLEDSEGLEELNDDTSEDVEDEQETSEDIGEENEDGSELSEESYDYDDSNVGH